MYNEKVKQEFLDKMSKEYAMSYVNSIQRVFNLTEKYEVQLQKDISTFTKDEIFNMFSDLKMEVLSLTSFTSYLRKYTFETTGTIGNFNYKPKELAELMSGSKKNCVTYATMQEWLDKLINPLDCFILYGFFYGVSGMLYCEASCSSMEGSDEENKTIWLAGFDDDDKIILKGRQIQADDKLFSYAKKASEATYYYQENCKGVKRKIALENNGRMIFKNPINVKEATTAVSIKARGQKKIKAIAKRAEIPPNIKPRDIYYSGLLYNLQKAALEQGLEIKQVTDFLNLKDLSKLEKQYNVTINRRFLKDKVGRYM